MISHKYKAIFIHIPKCAGTSMEVFLKNNTDACFFNEEEGVEHLLKKQLLSSIINTYPNYFMFSFVRNPYDRFISVWKHSIRSYSSDVSSYFYRKEKYISLKDYAYLVHQKNLKQLSGFDLYHSLPQSRFIPDFNVKMFGKKLTRNRSCDFIGRFENLEEDFQRLCSLLQIDAHILPRFMVSPEKETAPFERSYGMYYDAELLGIVRKIYLEDFNRLGYSHDFGSIPQTLQFSQRIMLSSKLILGDIRKSIRRLDKKARSLFHSP